MTSPNALATSRAAKAWSQANPNASEDDFDAAVEAYGKAYGVAAVGLFSIIALLGLPGDLSHWKRI